MKAISLWQPWASLLVGGPKRIETRSWATAHRGPLAIHAAARWDKGLRNTRASEPFASALRRCRFGPADELPRGCIVGTVNLVEVFFIDAVDREYFVQRSGFDVRCLRTVVIPPPLDSEELAFGDYTPGRFAWVLDGFRVLPRPIPFAGRQGLFNVPGELFAEGGVA